ncbi:MAG TPA: hypothetical protein VIH90_05360 [Candidatus Saccharimonadales bacterium]
MAASHQATTLSSNALPLSIIQPVDIGHLLRELNEVDEKLRQDKIRSDGGVAKGATELKLSGDLSELMKQANLDINDQKVRSQMIEYLEHLKKDAPVLHISFSSEPSKPFLSKITAWLRQEVDPNTLVIVGLDPTIGAGSIVRTANHVFDFSLSTRLKKNHNILGEKIKQVTTAPAPEKPLKENHE